MTIDEIKSYFQDHFYVERLTSKTENKTLIQSFEAPKKGFKLGEYLHEKAWTDDLEGEIKVYLIKDENDFLVAFFSVKCGLLYDSHEYEKLEGDELQDLMIIKPDYDKKCQAMIQDVSEIERNESAFWARYKKDN